MGEQLWIVHIHLRMHGFPYDVLIKIDIEEVDEVDEVLKSKTY